MKRKTFDNEYDSEFDGKSSKMKKFVSQTYPSNLVGTEDSKPVSLWYGKKYSIDDINFDNLMRTENKLRNIIISSLIENDTYRFAEEVVIEDRVDIVIDIIYSDIPNIHKDAIKWHLTKFGPPLMTKDMIKAVNRLKMEI